jgi:hypothetical protein
MTPEIRLQKNVAAYINGMLEANRRAFGSARMEDVPPPPAPDPSGLPPAGYTPPASQADLDRIINERLTRERGKFADYNDLKTKATKLDQIEQANASELEKAVSKAKDEGRAEVQTAANTRLIKAEARALAAAAKFRDPADAVAFLNLADVEVSEDGDVDAKKVKALLDELATSKPYLITDDTPPPPPSFNGGPRATGDTPADPRSRDLAQIEADVAKTRRST